MLGAMAVIAVSASSGCLSFVCPPHTTRGSEVGSPAVQLGATLLAMGSSDLISELLLDCLSFISLLP
jgi:hypothetical protein